MSSLVNTGVTGNCGTSHNRFSAHILHLAAVIQLYEQVLS